MLQLDLRHFNFTSYLNSAREGFIGRKWLFDRIEDILYNRTKDLSAIIIIGEPGSGKSAIAAQLICSRSSSLFIHNSLLGYHLCKHLDKITKDGGKFVRNLVDMIASQIPKFTEIISSSSVIQRVLREDCSRDPHGCFEQAIIAPLGQLKVQTLERKLYFIVVDAIDECACSDSGSVGIGSSIAELIRHKMLRLPSWLKLIITSRNDSKMLKLFSKSVKVDLFSLHSSNMDDIEIFVTATLYEHSSLFQEVKNFFKFDDDDISSLTSSLLHQSQGNFLFVKELLHLWLSETSVSAVKSIPPSIDGIYYSYFERAFGSEDNFKSARKILEVLVASFVPLSQEKIFKVLYLQDPKRDYTYSDFINKLNGLSHFLRYGEGNSVSLFHLSLLEWLIDENNLGSPFFIDKQKGHLALATYYLKNVNSSSTWIGYSQTFFLHLAQHIAFSGQLSSFYDEFQKIPTTLITTPVDDGQRTLLHLAAAVKNVDTIRLLLPSFSKPKDLKDNYGVTPAFVAAAQGALDNLKFLLEDGANISHRTNPPPRPPYEFHQDPIIASKTAFWSSTLLHAASQNGHFDVVKFLLQQNVSLTERDGVNFSALQLAAQNGHLEVVALLYKNGAQADQVALYHAAVNGHDDVVKFLLQNASVKDECMRCDGSFYWLDGKARYQAALIEPEFKANGDYKKFKSAVWHLAQPKHHKLNISDFRFIDDKHLIFCQTALHASVLKSHIRVVQILLLQSDNALQCTDFSGRTPLHDAVRSNNKAITEVLLRAGANVLRRCSFHQNLTSPCPRSYRKYDHLNLMEEYQYDTVRCPYRSTPMHLAAIYGHSEVAAVLNNYGASFHTTDFQGATSLHIAACHGKTGFIQWLISFSPTMHINTAAENGSTPLHSAAICGRFAEIPILIGLGADTKSQDKKGMTALHYTALIPSRKSMSRSVPSENHDDSNEFETQVYSFTRLKVSISKDEHRVRFDYLFDEGVGRETRLLSFDHHCKTARALMEHIDVTTTNQEDNLGRTALHLAAKNGLECIVAFLLANKALSQKENNAGLTPIEEAMQSCDPLGTFDALSVESELDEKMYDTLITQTECEIPESNPSIKDLIDHLLGHLDYQTAVVHILLSWELEVQGNEVLESVLHRSIKERQPHFALLTLLMGADVNYEDRHGRTPLLAYLHHGGNYTGFILKHFDVFTPVKCWEPFSSSPFHLLSYRTSAWSEFAGQMYLRLESFNYPENLYELASKCQDAEGYTPLHRAAQGGNIEAIETFLSWGVDVNMLSRDGHSPLFLAIKDAGLKPDLISSEIVDTTRASKAAILIFKEVLRKTNFKIRCDGTSMKLTIYHLAAYRGLHGFLYHLLGDLKPHGFDIDCPDKYGVTPLYLAKLFARDEMDNPFDPWKKIVLLIESYGGKLRYPQREAELRLLYTHLYDTSTLLTNINISLAEDLLQLIESTNYIQQCFQMFDSYSQRNDSDTFLSYSVLKPISHHLKSFQNELLEKRRSTASADLSKVSLDYFTTMEGTLTHRKLEQSTDEEKTTKEDKDEQKEKMMRFIEDPSVNLNDQIAEFAQLWKKTRKEGQLVLSRLRSQYKFVHTLLSQLSDFFSRNKKWLSRFSSVRAMKTAFPVLHQKLTCEMIATYKGTFLLNLHLHLTDPENGWVWKRQALLEVPFMRSRLPLILKNVADFWSPFKKQHLVQLINIVLRKQSKFDYLDALAFGNDRSLWNSIHRLEFDWSVRIEGREKNMKKVSNDVVKSLVSQMKEDFIAAWRRKKRER